MPTTLPTNTFGKTGLEVTRLGFGAMELRDGPRGRSVSEDRAGTVLNNVLDSGINFIDTSNDYGRSEEFIGRYISHRRDEYYLATKCGCVPGGGEHIWTRENIFRAIDESLERMKTDHVEVLQLHGASVEDCEREGIVDTLNEIRDQGKVRWIGASTTVPNLPTYIDWGSFDAFQIPYSAMSREHEGWITKSADAGIGTIIRGGVAKGEPGEGLGRAERWQLFDEANLGELQEEGESRTAFMMRLTLSHPQVQTIIAGSLNINHIQENAKTAQRGPLAPDVYEEAKRRLQAAGETPADTG